MVNEVIEITKEEYEKLLSVSAAERYEFIYDIACHSGYHPCGYGFYSPTAYQSDDRYYVKWIRGRNCD